jgi:hypothetical protein
MNEMPLNDRDFAEIRGNVMREIARRRRRNGVFAAMAVAFAVLAIVFVLVPRPVRKHRGGEAAAAPLRTPPPVVGLSGAPAASPAVVATLVQPKKKHHQHHRKPEPIAIAASEPMTIELQTANPDVRIIWIAK